MAGGIDWKSSYRAAKWALRLCLVMMMFMSSRSDMMDLAWPRVAKAWSLQSM